jgi:hypothetical protein
MANEILKIIPTVMAMNLLEDNLDYPRKKKKKKSVARQGMDNMIGVMMIDEVSSFI